MVTVRKVSSVGCKCLFNRPEHNTKGVTQWDLIFKGSEVQKSNLPTDKVQSGDEENGVICQVIMFTPRFRVINTQNMNLLVFSADNSKKSVAVWVKPISTSRRSYWVLSENGMINRLLSDHSCDI